MLKLNEEYPILQFRISGIYKIQNKINGKCYIGASKNILIRVQQHIKRSNNFKLRQAMRKYGKENFTLTVLEIVADLTKLLEREIYYISLFHATETDRGYNILTDNKQIFDGIEVSKSLKNKVARTKDLVDFDEIPNYLKVPGATLRRFRKLI